jgi:hypothetical protein
MFSVKPVPESSGDLESLSTTIKRILVASKENLLKLLECEELSDVWTDDEIFKYHAGFQDHQQLRPIVKKEDTVNFPNLLLDRLTTTGRESDKTSSLHQQLKSTRYGVIVGPSGCGKFRYNKSSL